MRPKTKQKRNDGGQKYPIIIICNEIHLRMDKFHWEKFLMNTIDLELDSQMTLLNDFNTTQKGPSEKINRHVDLNFPHEVYCKTKFR